MSVKEQFIQECIKNREYLGFTYLDMSNCLIDMSENDYKNFELGKYEISKENAIRLTRILCLQKPKNKTIELEFDDDISDEDKEDLLKIASELEGDF